jgi:general stress protein YciG
MRNIKGYKDYSSKYLPKEELDKMTENDIENYRYSILNEYTFDDDSKQYLNELELYKEIRFELNKKFLQEILDKGDKHSTGDELNDKVRKLLFSVMGREGGFETLVNGQIEDMRKRVGDHKFIFGI